MSTAPASPPVDRAAPRETTRRRHRRPVGLAIGTVAALAALGWWHLHPTAFSGAGDEATAFRETLDPVYVGMAWPPSGSTWRDVRVHDAQPRVQVFGDAEAEIWMCTDGAIGVVGEQDVGSACTPLDSSGDVPWEVLALRVTADEPGVVVVFDGIDVTYAHGLQRGSQHTGISGVIVFPHDEP